MFHPHKTCADPQPRPSTFSLLLKRAKRSLGWTEEHSPPRTSRLLPRSPRTNASCSGTRQSSTAFTVGEGIRTSSPATTQRECTRTSSTPSPLARSLYCCRCRPRRRRLQTIGSSRTLRQRPRTSRTTPEVNRLRRATLDHRRRRMLIRRRAMPLRRDRARRLHRPPALPLHLCRSAPLRRPPANRPSFARSAAEACVLRVLRRRSAR